MKSDVIHVNNDGVGIKEARDQAEKVAVFLALDKKSALHLYLLTEETMSMMQALTGQTEADFWIESDHNKVSLHLKASTLMTADMRQKLLAVSTTGKNVAVKGVMGKIRDIFQRLLEPSDENDFPPAALSMGYPGSGMDSVATLGLGIWSLRTYKGSLSAGNGPKEDWDELEKSIVSKLADDVQIGIINDSVEMIIIKTF